MDTNELEEEIRALIAEHLQLENVDLDMSVEEAANSLELSTLMFAVEKRFQVTFKDSDIGRLRVLRDLATLVRDASS